MMMRDRPVSLFLALTFAWAWLLWGYWVVAMPPGGLVLSPQFLVMAIVGGLAPSLAAFITLRVCSGKGAALALLRRGLPHGSQWRSALAALAIAPALAGVTWLLGALVFPRLVWPEIPPLVPVLVVWPLLAALGEEFGWRGFLFPRLLSRYGDIPAGLIIGLIWGVWHLPADFVGLKASGDLFWLAFAVNGPFVLTAHALVMVALWRLTAGALPAMILYHLGITASAMVSPSVGDSVPSQIAFAALGAGVVWVAALVLLWWSARRPPLPST